MSTWDSNPSRLPSSKPTATTTAARGFSLSLLDNSPVPSPVDKNRPPPPNLQQQHPEIASTKSTSYYNDLIQQVTLWKMEMEQVRDDIYFLQIQNSQSLDALCMAGADMMMPNDGAAAAAATMREEEEENISD